MPTTTRPRHRHRFLLLLLEPPGGVRCSSSVSGRYSVSASSSRTNTSSGTGGREESRLKMSPSESGPAHPRRGNLRCGGSSRWVSPAGLVEMSGVKSWVHAHVNMFTNAHTRLHTHAYAHTHTGNAPIAPRSPFHLSPIFPSAPLLAPGVAHIRFWINSPFSSFSPILRQTGVHRSRAGG